MLAHRLTPCSLADVLRRLRVHGGRRPHLVVFFNDPRFDLSQFGACTNHGLPALDHGQKADCRFPVSGGQSVHAHWFEDRVELHLDLVDPQKSPLGHVATDTDMAKWAFWGGLGGLVLATLSGKPTKAKGFGGALTGAAVGAGIAAILDGGATSYWSVEPAGHGLAAARLNKTGGQFAFA